MLHRLFIRNYALIDNLDISFSNGLNIITGETGAGKSIILGALSLILGQRAENRYFFNQQKKCIIEGTFSVDSFHLEEFFSENDLDYEKETVLRREISSDGKSRSFINDTPVNLSTLKKLGEKLIDIHSQHATLEINDEDFQLLVIDTVAGSSQHLSTYQELFKSYKKTNRTLDELIKNSEQAKADQDYFQFQYEELEKAGIIFGELEALEKEQAVLTHAEEIKRSLLAALAILSESEINAASQLKEAGIHLAGAEKYNPEIPPISERLNSNLIELKDIISEIDRVEQSSYIDENRLNEVTERLDTIYTLQKKHRAGSAEELIQLQSELSEKLNKILFVDEDIERLQSELTRLRSELQAAATSLSEIRKSHTQSIEQQIQTTLFEIGMPFATLTIMLESTPSQFSQSGQDKVQFLFSANKGQTPLPMNKVASGGELSRLMLAIKSLIAVHTSLPTIIFDEIDTGISGETALRVGTIMQKLANNMQVIAITHLPQIASKGSSHYRVFKDESTENSQTNILKLDKEDRIQELAVMLSGHNPGESAIQNARELLR